ncbi:GDSL esterase/lipase At1g29670-like isoform X2 [Prosopis cineraria]|uniref:GDSL esterase/lipase At1g29670-like isoform X2 n=1 Tax=Prosopis cineraria TaxID=364024 RepID=UPI00240FDCFD|nr:GDSL esterase/lipase At1g29670-like isoform X2 [Prosopis cineraria]
MYRSGSISLLPQFLMAIILNRSWLMLILLLHQHDCGVSGKPQVPCIFIFGDSLSDSGNNNQLLTSSKANYIPYGIDFPSGPTGRFTNGRTAADFITQRLGFENLIPPFANISASDILKGVNYASGASGIRNDTGSHLGAKISLGLQIANHRAIASQIASRLGGDGKGRQYLKKCLYYVNIGSNDYLQNYFLPQCFPTSSIYNPEQFSEALIQEYSQHLRALYELGSRKFALFGLFLLGCVPNELTNHGDGSLLCVKEENRAVLMFNDKLRGLVDQLNEEFSDAKFIYVNSALISSKSPLLDGLRSIGKSGCCQVRADGMCDPNKSPCAERSLKMFFDSFHPTEAANHFLATLAYKSLFPIFAYPMDISHLVRL